MAEEAGKSQLLVQEPRCPGPGVGALAAHSTAIPARGDPGVRLDRGLRHRRLSDGPVSAARHGCARCAHASLRVADRAHHHRRHSGPAGRTAASAGHAAQRRDPSALVSSPLSIALYVVLGLAVVVPLVWRYIAARKGRGGEAVGVGTGGTPRDVDHVGAQADTDAEAELSPTVDSRREGEVTIPTAARPGG